MGRIPCCDKVGVKKGAWTPEEDHILLCYIEKNGHGNWRSVPNRAGLLRCGKSCRFRWANYLNPDIKRGNYSKEEEDTIIRLHGQLGNRWSKIAAILPGRTDNEIKNVWYTRLRKRLKQNPTTQDTSSPSSVEPNFSVNVPKSDNSSYMDVYPQHSSLKANVVENNFDGCESAEKMSDIFQSQFLQAETSAMQPDHLQAFDDLDLQSSLLTDYLSSSCVHCDETGSFWLKLLSFAVENEEESGY